MEMVSGEDEKQVGKETNSEGGKKMNRQTCWSRERDRKRAGDNK